MINPYTLVYQKIYKYNEKKEFKMIYYQWQNYYYHKQ